MPEYLNNGWFVMWAAIVLIVTVPVIMTYWHKIKRAEQDAQLKQQMLERGMSADEIVKVLHASSKGAAHDDECQARHRG